MTTTMQRKTKPKTAPSIEGDIVAIPLPSGVYALVWMLEGNHCLVMDGYWQALPSAREAAAARPSKACGADLLPDQDDVWKGWFEGVYAKDFVVVGRREPSARERGYVANYTGTMVFGDAEAIRAELHRAWRLVHDRLAVEAEWAAADEARAKREATRCATLTLRKALRERMFVRWDEYLPQRVVREVRTIFREATKELLALEKSGTKRQRVAALRRIVTKLNAFDDDKGFIESVERDQIMRRIEELARLVGLTNKDEALSGHRDW